MCLVRHTGLLHVSSAAIHAQPTTDLGITDYGMGRLYHLKLSGGFLQPVLVFVCGGQEKKKEKKDVRNQRARGAPAV